jgi:hypothetical protein
MTASLLPRIARTAVAGVAVVSALVLIPGAAAGAVGSQAFIPAPQVIDGGPNGQTATAPASTAPPGTLPAPATPPVQTAGDPAALSPAAEQWIEQQTAAFRRDVEVRVGRGDMTPDEAERLIAWRHWQLTQQAAGLAPHSSIVEAQNAGDSARRQMMVVPGPFFVPPPVVCAGGINHHFAGSFCF